MRKPMVTMVEGILITTLTIHGTTIMGLDITIIIQTMAITTDTTMAIAAITQVIIMDTIQIIITVITIIIPDITTIMTQELIAIVMATCTIS